MSEVDRPVYCTRCGSIVSAEDKFCGTCGAGVSPDAQVAAPTEEIPTIVRPPQGARGESRGRAGGRRLTLFLALGALLVLVVGVGTLAAMTLGGGDEPRGTAEPQPPSATWEETTVREESTQAPDERTTETEALLVGESVEEGGVRVRLNGLRLLGETEIDRPRQNGGTFLATDLTFENTSDEPVAVSSLLEFVLKDEDGYSANQTIHSEQRQLSEGEIPPGQRTSGEIVYDLPPDAQQDLQLDYNPVAGETRSWSVGDAANLPEPPEPSTPDDVYPAPPMQDDEPVAPEEEPADAEVAQAVKYYYEAADQEDWSYTYENLDHGTQALFTEEDWYQRNQWFADNGPSVTTSPDVDVTLSPSGNGADVTVYRTFSDGSSLTRETAFVYEGGLWKHRFVGEEIDLFMPGVPFEDFVAAQ